MCVCVKKKKIMVVDLFSFFFWFILKKWEIIKKNHFLKLLLLFISMKKKEKFKRNCAERNEKNGWVFSSHSLFYSFTKKDYFRGLEYRRKQKLNVRFFFLWVDKCEL